MNIGEKIKKLRIELGMTVEELAAKLEKNRATIYRYERGDIENMPLDVLVPLSKALNTTPGYLMGWEENTQEMPSKKGMTIGDLIKTLRTKKHMTLEKLSDELNISANDLMLYETNLSPVTVDVLNLVLNYFDVSLSDLSETKEIKKHNKTLPTNLTDEEYKKLLDYANFLLFQRGN